MDAVSKLVPVVGGRLIGWFGATQDEQGEGRQSWWWWWGGGGRQLPESIPGTWLHTLTHT